MTGNASAAHEKAANPMDYIFLKDFDCPVCYKTFQAYIIRQSKLKKISVDSDSRATYQDIDPTYYDVLVCGLCNYAAQMSAFNALTERQADMIRQKGSVNINIVAYPVPLSVGSAIERFKMALLNTEVKGGKNSEKAFICLKMSWFYRDMRDFDNEKKYLQVAYEQLKAAYTSERIPIGSLDENQMVYLIAELARRAGDYNEALRWVSTLIVKKNISDSLKNRALSIKESIRELQK
ncbi:MAG: DUF2225 domain-containing protein [Defluviitaleaceae bacterium]|nr:DUF2225 domain-containing protein [Defluviitaleaceae bacterium]